MTTDLLRTRGVQLFRISWLNPETGNRGTLKDGRGGPERRVDYHVAHELIQQRQREYPHVIFWPEAVA